MFPLLNALEFWKAMKDKFPKSFLILKEIRFFRQVSTKLQDYGTLIQESAFKSLKVMKTKFSHVCSTTKETPLLQVQRTTLARSGEIRRYIRTNECEKSTKNLKEEF